MKSQHSASLKNHHLAEVLLPDGQDLKNIRQHNVVTATHATN
jgi:hypothetical protein